MTQDWRIQTNGEDYLRAQNKRVNLENRRPVIRKASDLVGPGIGAEAVKITDYNDILATFNGYYSSDPGALYAPNDSEAFIGSVIMDSVLGGIQTFISLVSGNEYRRTFLRNPSDETSISFGVWHTDEVVPATAYSQRSSNIPVQTVLENNVSAACALPGLLFIGDPDTYAPTVDSLIITRPGVYTGYYWWHTTTEIEVGILQTEFPNGTEQTFDVLFNIPGNTGVQVPLTFYTADADGFIRVTAKQTSGSPATAEFLRLHLTRIGDAP